MFAVNKNTIYSGLFFFFVLNSIFVLRPFRNTIAADIGTADLTFFLFIVVLVMLLVNPIYSFIVSKSSQKNIVPFIYGFFILNLLIFLSLNSYFPNSSAVKATFYVWYNVFNFFLVAIFWAMTVNSFNLERAKVFFGLISACGSLGASFGGLLVSNYLYDKENLSLVITIISMLLAIYFSSRVERQEQVFKGDSSTFKQVFEQFTQIKENPLIRNFIFYAFIWTCLSTALWFFQLEIINNFTNDSAVKTQIFGRADSMVPIITLATQLLLTSYFLRSKYLGIRFVLTMYGVLFTVAFFAVSGYFSEYLLSASGITLFLILQGTMRPFEYGLNKPAREKQYSLHFQLKKNINLLFLSIPSLIGLEMQQVVYCLTHFFLLVYCCMLLLSQLYL